MKLECGMGFRRIQDVTPFYDLVIGLLKIGMVLITCLMNNFGILGVSCIFISEAKSVVNVSLKLLTSDNALNAVMCAISSLMPFTSKNYKLAMVKIFNRLKLSVMFFNLAVVSVSSTAKLNP